MEAMKSAVLPILAIFLAVMGITYSACSKTQASSTVDNQSAVLRTQIDHFEMALKEIQKVNDQNVKTYSDQMGCNAQSTMLDVIKKNNDLLTHYSERLDYHRLLLIQADTMNAERNKEQLEELKKDQDQLDKDGKIIKDAFLEDQPQHVTK